MLWQLECCYGGYEVVNSIVIDWSVLNIELEVCINVLINDKKQYFFYVQFNSLSQNSIKSLSIFLFLFSLFLDQVWFNCNFMDN